jgi:hypothetical protein
VGKEENEVGPPTAATFSSSNFFDLILGQTEKGHSQSEQMPTLEEHILRILGEATEPLFASEIADHLNREVRTRLTNAPT